jgi:hypothetical protein
MKTLVTLAAAAALAIGFAGTASAVTPALNIAPQISSGSNIEQAGYTWFYKQGWKGNCFYRYLYVTNGYRYAYRWTRTCV